MTRRLLIALAAVLGPALAVPAGAQTLLQQGGDEPMVIESDDGLEWVRDEKKITARGNARAVRGGVELRGDSLIALYRDATGADGNEVYRVLAEGNVIITSRNERVFGDRGAYDVDAKNFVLVGDNLRIEFKDGIITARDQLEYWEAKQLFVARGDATVVRADRRLRADLLSALVGAGAGGKQEIQQINVWGKVHVSTPTEIVRAEKGVYNVRTGIVKLEENVRITRDKTQLNGNAAEVDLNTGISRLLGGKGRVRGLIRPGKS